MSLSAGRQPLLRHCRFPPFEALIFPFLSSVTSFFPPLIRVPLPVFSILAEVLKVKVGAISSPRTSSLSSRFPEFAHSDFFQITFAPNFSPRSCPVHPRPDATSPPLVAPPARFGPPLRIIPLFSDGRSPRFLCVRFGSLHFFVRVE